MISVILRGICGGNHGGRDLAGGFPAGPRGTVGRVWRRRRRRIGGPDGDTRPLPSPRQPQHRAGHDNPVDRDRNLATAQKDISRRLHWFRHHDGGDRSRGAATPVAVGTSVTAALTVAGGHFDVTAATVVSTPSRPPNPRSARQDAAVHCDRNRYR
jgi:hypothetical protein